MDAYDNASCQIWQKYAEVFYLNVSVLDFKRDVASRLQANQNGGFD